MPSNAKKSAIDSALDSFYSSLDDPNSSQNKEVQPPIEEEPDDKHTFKERKIIKNYQKKPLNLRQTVPSQLCKVCGSKVSVDEMANHVRIELMNPKYFVQRKAEMERAKNPNGDNDIYRHLREFAERRTDIFGDTELTIGQSIEEDSKQAKKRERERVIWDGHSTSITEVIASKVPAPPEPAVPKKGISPTPPPIPMKPPMPVPLMNVKPPTWIPTMPPPIPVTFIPEPIPMPPPLMPTPIPQMMPLNTFIAPPIPPFPVYSSGAEPPAKRKKPENENNLLSADQFMKNTNERNVRLTIEVPNEPNKEKLSLNGQILHLECSLLDNILHLKEQLETILGGMKPNRQKLITQQGIVLKDQSTFAELNLAGDINVQLKVKERGGKK